MPGTPTPNYGWPIPALTDPPDGPAQIGALGNAIDTTLKAEIGTPDVAFTPGGMAGFILGNGIYSCAYRKLGSHVHIFFMASAAAVSPTSAFVSGNMTFSIPFASKRTAQGLLYFNGAGAIPFKVGTMMSNVNSTFLYIFAVRQTDLGFQQPAIVWGTTPWAVGATLVGDILIPI